jgi:cleavage and polyadenylation specificity factor subunit 5
MLQIANAFFKLPGDYLLPHEEEIPGFQARLEERLSPPPGSSSNHLVTDNGDETSQEWTIHDCVAQWWRPNFETFMYPFIPAHVTRPKECKKMYLIQLPKKSRFHCERAYEGMLSVPKNMKLLAVPLFELYDNTARYGPQLSVYLHVLRSEIRLFHIYCQSTILNS